MQAPPQPRSARPASGRRPSQPQVPPTADAMQQQQESDSTPAAGAAAAGAVAPAGRSLEAMQPEDVYMDGIIHRLQLLNYEREFCKRKKPYRKGLTPYYFAAAQPGLSGNEQFFYFTSLAVWLLRLCGITLPSPKEFGDPNTTLQCILQGLKSLGFAAPSYAPTKLLAGWGREVCVLLDGLTDVTLERRGLNRLPKTVFVQDGADDGDAAVEEEVTQDDDAADITSQAAAALLLAAQDSSSSDDMHLAGVLHGPAASGGMGARLVAAAAEASPVKQMLVSTVDPVAWKLEVERVAPKLRVAVAPDMRDWRQHLDVAHTHMGTMAAAWPDVRLQLEQLSSDVSASLDKMAGREQQLTGQFQGLLDAYRESRQQHTEMQEEFSRRTELISERNDELHRVAAALEDAKQQLENSGSNLTDASPLARLKAAMSSLREELKGMELRIGVVAHNLMSLSLADKQLSLQDAARRRVKDVTTAKSGALA